MNYIIPANRVTRGQVMDTPEGHFLVSSVRTGMPDGQVKISAIGPGQKWAESILDEGAEIEIWEAGPCVRGTEGCPVAHRSGIESDCDTE